MTNGPSVNERRVQICRLTTVSKHHRTAFENFISLLPLLILIKKIGLCKVNVYVFETSGSPRKMFNFKSSINIVFRIGSSSVMHYDYNEK